jgi:hypothetical protein
VDEGDKTTLRLNELANIIYAQVQPVNADGSYTLGQVARGFIQVRGNLRTISSVVARNNQWYHEEQHKLISIYWGVR